MFLFFHDLSTKDFAEIDSLWSVINLDSPVDAVNFVNASAGLTPEGIQMTSSISRSSYASRRMVRSTSRCFQLSS